MADQIQAAPDALKRWGEEATPGPWVSAGGYDFPAVYASGELLADVQTGLPADVTLIVAMTDPALREALDRMLADAGRDLSALLRPDVVEHAERIAAVILDIDRRVSA